ncbi:MAG: hypothetical protein ACRETM_09030 [Stenotrophobium sp.]
MNSRSGHAGQTIIDTAASPRRWARWGSKAVASAALGVLATLAGCGSNSDDFFMPYAFAELGQPNYNSAGSNFSAKPSAVNAKGVASPFGGAAVYVNGPTTLFYVADTGNNRILGWKSIPLSSSTPPDFVLGQSNFTSNSLGANANQLNGPSSVRVETNPANPAVVRLVVADTGNSRVLVWNTLPTTTAAAADEVIGQSGFGVANSNPNQGAAAPSATTLKGPTDAAIAFGKMFIVDNGNDRVLIYNDPGSSLANNQAADVVLGQPDMVTDQAGCVGTNLSTACTSTTGVNIANFVNSSKQLYKPTGLDTNGTKLLVADTGNNRVMYWQNIPQPNASQADGVGASSVVGVNAFNTTSNGSNGPAGLNSPTGVAGLSGNSAGFYVADRGNNRVLFYASLPVQNGQPASTVLGQSTFTRDAANDDNQDGVSDAPSGTSGSGSLSVPSQRTLNGPSGVIVYNGVLYVTDTANNRIMEFSAN